jgi:hypothetical protein
MVSFRTLTTLALAAVAAAQSTPAQVITNLNNLKLKSQGLQNIAFTINIINGPLVAIGQGPLPVSDSHCKVNHDGLLKRISRLTLIKQIISGIHDISTTTNTYIQTGVATVSAGADAESILKSYRNFVSMHQALCTVLASKADLLRVAPFIGQPLVAVLSENRNVLKVSNPLAPRI